MLGVAIKVYEDPAVGECPPFTRGGGELTAHHTSGTPLRTLMTGGMEGTGTQPRDLMG